MAGLCANTPDQQINWEAVEPKGLKARIHGTVLGNFGSLDAKQHTLDRPHCRVFRYAALLSLAWALV